MKPDYKNASMLDMVFENRNKAYGAYVLRTTYHQSLSKALLITVTSVFLLCFIKFLHDRFNKNYVPPLTTNGLHVLAELPIFEKNKIVEQKQEQKAEAKPKTTIANTEKRIMRDENGKADSIPTKDDLQKVESGLTSNTYANGDNTGVDGGKGTKSTLEPASPGGATEATVWDVTEVMPSFPGGEKKLMDFLRDHTEYPYVEKDLGMQGKAYVRFIVNEDGSVSNAEVVHSDSKGFGKEGVKVVGMLPHFTPGKQGGQNVKVHLTLPFIFKIND
jgi:protein TonB